MGATEWANRTVNKKRMGGIALFKRADPPAGIAAANVSRTGFAHGARVEME